MHIERIADGGPNTLELYRTPDDTNPIVISADLVSIYPAPSVEDEAPDWEVKVHKIAITGIEDGGSKRVRIRTRTGSMVLPSSSVDITPLGGDRGRDDDLEITLQEAPQIFGRHVPITEDDQRTIYSISTTHRHPSNSSITKFDINGVKFL